VVFGSKIVGPKVGLLEKGRVILTNEFSLLYRAIPSLRHGLVLRSWPAFGGHLFTNSDEGEERVIESMDTVFSPLNPEPALGAD
jgi:hypothetical protein